MAEYLDRIRKLSALLFIVSVLLILATLSVPSDLPLQRGPIAVLLLVGMLTGVGVYCFPWRRYDPNWFLVIGVLASALVAGLVHFSGGRQSMYFPVFVFIIAASGAYYTALPLALLTTIASLASLAWMLETPVSRDDLLRSLFEIAIYVTTACLCNAIFRGLERSNRAAERYAQTLAILHELDLLVIAGAPPSEFAHAVLGRLGDAVPFEAGWVGQISVPDARVAWLAAVGAVGDAAPASELREAEWALLRATRKGPVVGDGAGDPLRAGGPNWLVQALQVAEEPRGVLILRRPPARPWTADERVAVAAVAGQTAVGLERARWLAEAARAEARDELARGREEFLAQVSHELRGPLMMLSGGTELLEAGGIAPTEAPLLVGRMRVATERVQALIDDLLEVVSAERAGWTLDPRPTDLVAVLREATVALLGEAAVARVTVQAPDRLPPVAGDAARLGQVFGNLLGNAAKYSPDGAPILVQCESDGESVTVRVVDRGIGIAPDALGRVFEKFYRAPNELGRGIPGTGLGLAIVRELVEAHGGRLWAESPGVGRGSTFVVVLPRHDRATDRSTAR